MARIYWKGGTGGTKSDPSTQANWCNEDGTAISNSDWNSGNLAAHDIVFDRSKNITVSDPVGLIFDGSPATHTWKSLTVKKDGNWTAADRTDSLFFNMIQFGNSGTTLILSGLDIRQPEFFSATGNATIKFTGVPYFSSSRRAIPTITGSTGGGNDQADLYIKIYGDINLPYYRQHAYDATNLQQNSYKAAGIFKDEASRSYFTFLFEPPDEQILVLDDGIYPNMNFQCASGDTATLAFDFVYSEGDNNKTNTFNKVDMLKLTVHSSFNVKPTDYNMKNKDKYIIIREGYTLQCSTFDMGYASLEIIPSSTIDSTSVNGYVPSNDTQIFGPTSSTTQAMGMKTRFSTLVIGTPKDENKVLNLVDNTILVCDNLVIKSGGRLYGSEKEDGKSAEIHCLNQPTIEGDWNFTQIAEGIYRPQGTPPILPVSMGGTGLATIGTQGQVLAVKSNGSGLEWRADTTIPNTNTFILVGEESDNYISSSTTAGNANGFVFSFGNGAQNSNKSATGSDIGVILPVACTLTRVDITFGNIGSREDTNNQTLTVHKNGVATTTTLVYNSNGSGSNPFKRNFTSLSGSGLSYAAGDTFNLKATGLSGFLYTEVGPARMTAYFTVS